MKGEIYCTEITKTISDDKKNV